MFRLALLPLFLFIGGVLVTILAFYLIRRIKRALNHTLKKGGEIVCDQQQKWSEREQRKKLPEIVQRAHIQFDEIQADFKELPEQWQIPLRPIVEQSNEILMSVSSTPEKTDSVRSFFNHTLDALLQLIKKLKTDYMHMGDQQTEKARQNITVFKADLIQHQRTLKKLKHFDFDVLMDVIKARLKR